MNCQEVTRLSVAYLNGEATASERSLVFAHLAGCASCREDLNELQAFQDHVKQSLQKIAESVSPSPEARQALLERLAQPAGNDPAERRRVFPAPASQDDLSNRMPWSDKPLRRITLAALIALACFLGLVTSVPAAREMAFAVIRRVVTGPNSSAVQITRGAASEPQPLPEDMWIVRTAIGNFGGNAPPGVEPVVSSFASLEEAQAVVDFHILTPAWLPQGYALRQVKTAPIGASAWVFQFYGGSGTDVIVVQMPVGEQPGSDPDVLTSVGVGVMTGSELEPVDFDGRRAVWVDGLSLMWEQNGTAFQVGGPGLSLEQAMQLARSLK